MNNKDNDSGEEEECIGDFKDVLQEASKIKVTMHLAWVPC